jgi:hypothetical protein
VGAGYVASATRLGDAISLPDSGVISGVDGGIMAAFGNSTVVESVMELWPRVGKNQKNYE